MKKQFKAILLLSGAIALAGCVEDEISSSHYSSSVGTTSSYGSSGRHVHHNQGYSTSQDSGSYVSDGYSSDGYATSVAPRRKAVNQAVAPAGSSGFQSSTGVSPEASGQEPTVETGTTTSSSSSVPPVESAPVSGFSSSS